MRGFAVFRLGLNLCHVAASHVAVDHLDIGQAFSLNHAVCHVDSETGCAAVKPEAQDAVELVAHLWVLPVQVGLRRVKDVQVPLPGGAIRFGNTGPGDVTENRLPVVRRQLTVLAATITEHVARALGAARPGCKRRLEPGVLS